MLKYPNFEKEAEIKKREEQRVFCDLIFGEEIGRFIQPGYADCRKGPGDKTGASYAFDLYDFDKGTYHYII